MKTVILAGGLGTRLSEETTIKPKPLIEIGGLPILWHIMKIYSAFGLNDFVVCLGSKRKVRPKSERADLDADGKAGPCVFLAFRLRLRGGKSQQPDTQGHTQSSANQPMFRHFTFLHIHLHEGWRFVETSVHVKPGKPAS
jgi:hypothetical protein